MKKSLLFALLATFPVIVFAQGLSSKVLYDSGSVSAGTQIQSPVIDLQANKVTRLEVIVDNTAATVVRDLTMTSYLVDGTSIDSVIVRRVFFGIAQNGSIYDPGRARVFIGPDTAPPTNGVYLLYDALSTANAAATTHALDTQDLDSIFGWSKGAGGTHTFSCTGFDDAGAGLSVFGASTAAADNTFAWPTAGPENVGAGNWRVSMWQPRRVTCNTSAGGVGIQVRMIVYGRGRTPGHTVIPMVLPPKVQFTLGAAGAAAARVTVVGL